MCQVELVFLLHYIAKESFFEVFNRFGVIIDQTEDEPKLVVILTRLLLGILSLHLLKLVLGQLYILSLDDQLNEPEISPLSLGVELYLRKETFQLV